MKVSVRTFQFIVIAAMVLIQMAPAFAGVDSRLPQEAISEVSRFCRTLESDPSRPRTESSEASCIQLGLKYFENKKFQKREVAQADLSAQHVLSLEDTAGLYVNVCSQLKTVVAYSDSEESEELTPRNKSKSGKLVDPEDLLERRSACFKFAYDGLASLQPALMAQFAQPQAVEWQKNDVAEESNSAKADQSNCTDFNGVTVLNLKATGLLARHYRACSVAAQADVLYDWKGAAVFYVRYRSEWERGQRTPADAGSKENH